MTNTTKGAAGATGATRERWEDVQRTWDTVQESADGTLAAAISDLSASHKRRRVLRDTRPLQRGIIRHVVLLLDMSSAMTETDMKPTRLGLVLNTAAAFVHAFFSQNPISQLAILITRDGLAQRLTDLSGSPATHLSALDKLRPKPNPQGKSGYTAEIEVKGSPSLENSLSLARGMLSAAPTHGTKEVLIVYAALQTSDPGNIHDVIRRLVEDRIRVSVVGLAARLRVLMELVAKTHGLGSASAPAAMGDTVYGVALDETHFRTLLMTHTTPPATTANEQAARKPSMIPMGFPSHFAETQPSLCACHHVPSKGGFLCTRCGSKLCGLPMQCPVCGLQCVQSTHLARSFHHLFPLRNWKEVRWDEARRKGVDRCTGCLTVFPEVPMEVDGEANGVEEGVRRMSMAERRRRESGGHGRRGAEEKKASGGGMSESSRYACTVCGCHFCIDCDVFAHEVLHNCAGCLRSTRRREGEAMDVSG